jgi:aspartate/methionine/tyrosine aminotransferase
MSRPLSRRSGAVDPFIVMDVMAAAAAKEAVGDTVIHLEVGQPSTPAPRGAGGGARRARRRPHRLRRGARHARHCATHRAALSRGLPGPRSRPERVVVTTGSSGGFPLAFLASFDAGDRHRARGPGYPAYRNILAALNSRRSTCRPPPPTASSRPSRRSEKAVRSPA